MKKTFLFVILSVLLLSSCDKSNTSTSEPIVDPVFTNESLVVVGQDRVPGEYFYNAVVWIDGVRTVLSDGTIDSFAMSVCSASDSVFVVGCQAVGAIIDDGYYEPYNASNPAVWAFSLKNPSVVKKVNYTEGFGPVEAWTSGCAYSNGNFYVSGYVGIEDSMDRKAVYWKNGELNILTDGSTDAVAYCVAAEGEDVYVGGYIQDAQNKSAGAAVIWKNGVAQKLNGNDKLAKVNKIAVSNGHVYAAGAIKPAGSGRWQGAIWIDGELSTFTEELGTEIKDIFVKEDGSWIICGNTSVASSIHAMLWYSDGSVVDLSPNSELCSGYAMDIDKEGAVYALGQEYSFDYSTFEEYYTPYLWKDAVLQESYAMDTPSDCTYYDLIFAKW